MIRNSRRASQRLFLASTAAIALALGAPLVAHAEPIAGYPAAPVAPKGAPNVLLIMTDDVGFGASSTFGGLDPHPDLRSAGGRGAAL